LESWEIVAWAPRFRKSRFELFRLSSKRAFHLHRLDGLQGIFLSRNGDESLVVSVEIIQRSLSIQVAGYRVEPI
jgi:hypothetical protein